MSRIDPPLPWQRLSRSYHADDTLVLVRAEHGLLAEVVFTRWLAHGKPIAAPEGQEGEIIAGVLGFEQADAPQLAAILRWFMDAGTVTATRKPGPRSKGTRNNCSYDLTNRGKYLPPNRFLTRSQRAPNSEKPQVDAPPDRDDARDDGGDASVTTSVATDVRTDERKPLAAKDRRAGLFDALLEATGGKASDLTRSARGALNKAGKDLDEVGATAEEIQVRAGRYRRRWPNAELTAPALAKHWATFAEEEDDPNAARTMQSVKLRAVATNRLKSKYGDRTEAIVDSILEHYPSIPLETVVAFAPRFAREIDQEDDRR